MSPNPRIIHLESLDAATAEMKELGVDPRGIERMAGKAMHFALKLEGISLKAANILKQEMLALGGDAALPWGAADLSQDFCPVLLLGTWKQLSNLTTRLLEQPFGLKEIAQEIESALQNYQNPPRFLRCRRYNISLDRTLIMGILNVTPDSFYDGGRYIDPGLACEYSEAMVDDGADIIDIGGESTRPGSSPVSIEEEWSRIETPLRFLVKRLNVPISVDTYKAEVARRALAEGADIINDISGLQLEPSLAKEVYRAGAGLVVMHMQGTPQTMQVNPEYQCLLGEIIGYLREAVSQAEGAGVDPASIIVDPGLGFGKTYEHNLILLKRLSEFRVLGKPILVGPSRKSFIGRALDLPMEERLEGTAAAVVASILKGASIVRVHDVKAMRRVAMVVDAIRQVEG